MRLLCLPGLRAGGGAGEGVCGVLRDPHHQPPPPGTAGVKVEGCHPGRHQKQSHVTNRMPSDQEEMSSCHTQQRKKEKKSHFCNTELRYIIWWAKKNTFFFFHNLSDIVAWARTPKCTHTHTHTHTLTMTTLLLS